MLSKQRARCFLPKLLRQERAADYVDVSLPFFLDLVRLGVFPPPRVISQKVKAWLRDDLDRVAEELPFVGNEPSQDAEDIVSKLK